MQRRRLLAGMGGVVGTSLSGCTDLVGSNPSLVTAIDVADAHLGSGEYPLDSITIRMDVEASWSQLPDSPRQMEVTVRTGPEDFGILEQRETGQWETEDSHTFSGLEGDLLDAFDPETFPPGDHAVECTLGIALYRSEEVIISETEAFAVEFTVEEAEESDGGGPENESDTDDEGEPAGNGGEAGSAAIDDVKFLARAPSAVPGGGFCREEREGRSVIGHVGTEDGRVDTIGMGTDEFTVSWESLPDTVPIVTWTGTVAGIERSFGYETGPFIWDPENPWPETHAATWDGGGTCSLYTPERRWLEGGRLDDIAVEEPGTTEYVGLEVTLTVRIWPDANIALEEVEPMATPTHEETVYLAVTRLDPSMEVSVTIDGEVE